MYIPEIYKNENPEEIRAFLKAHAFGILVTYKNGKSCATHIPLLLAQKEDGTEILHAHISKANEQASHLKDGTDALCIFNGPHAYVSSSWYDFEEVPTWNYIAVQVRGTIKVLNKEDLNKSVRALMDTYESGQEHPVKMDELSDKTMRQIQGIIGFEVEIKGIEAAYKLSQNQNDKNHSAVVDRFRKSGIPTDNILADNMETERKKQHKK